MTEPPIADAAQRERALAPDASFIVQAPAGSGKTELLTQRLLRLLAEVAQPEEVLAITFTRKAAAEMRHRIVTALQDVAQPCPAAAHRAHTWRLAHAAMERDRKRHWGIVQNTGRLKIQTVDGLCATLVRQMPIVSELGGLPPVSERPSELYEAAARRTLAAVESDLAEPIGLLLLHLDNNGARLTRLIADLLPKREQWLGHLLADTSREHMEASLARLIQDQLEGLMAGFPTAYAQELIELVGFAGAQLGERAGALASWPQRRGLPRADIEGLTDWQGLARLLLLKDKPQWRRQVTAREGFPAPSGEKDPARRAQLQAAKDRMKSLLAALSAFADFRERLDDIRALPQAQLNDRQWHILQALQTVLIRAAAELLLIFNERGEVDFSEIHRRAIQALGKPDDPTDIALALDYRLRHLLVDEFQDTSNGQLRLLELLTAGWEPGDGRTLFVVGDPMQSIYGFRDANVGLFLQAQTRGIGGLHLEPLRLSVNFRSRRPIVEWTNRNFSRIYPQTADVTSGAVTYTPSVAYQAHGAAGGVKLHSFDARQDGAEAELVCELVRQTRNEPKPGNIAVLGRTRSHLRECAQALKAAGMSFQALELEPLGQCMIVQDLHALTRALVHPGDRLAWLCVLRAPWCGLRLNDLLALSGEYQDDCLWDRLADPARRKALSADGQIRAQGLYEILAPAFDHRRRLPLRRWVEQTWVALAGPATYPDAPDQEAARSFFELLDQLDQAGTLPDPEALTERLAELYAPVDTSADGGVQLMTIHKAKGLEFDTVILPGLGRSPRHTELPLLAWQERVNRKGRTDLLLAPIRAFAEDDDPLQAYLRRLSTNRARLENGRLLYVAATRARKNLHLVAHYSRDPKTLAPKPADNSLLASLWPAVETLIEDATIPVDDPEPGVVSTRLELRRLTQTALARYRTPAPWPASIPTPTAPPPTIRLAVDPFAQMLRHSGTLVHRWLERIAKDGLHHWDSTRILAAAEPLALGLVSLGVGQGQLAAGVARCQTALRNCLEDARGRWILGPHAEQGTELPLTEWEGAAGQRYIIDRTFVDDQGLRWIIDFKTSSPEADDLTAFYTQEQDKYRQQLEGYARLLRRIEARQIRLGLYFPLIPGWLEWSPDL
jgi:ATP-dependent exoDNAse (exonuclease V) beta subunit